MLQPIVAKVGLKECSASKRTRRFLLTANR
jgi:hypothetical protein